MVWRPTALWSGQASIQTDSFLSETGVFRVHWESQSHRGYGYLRVTLHSDQRPAPAGEVSVDQRGTGQNMAHMHEDPCEFSPMIDASGVMWKVSLEEGCAPWPRTHSLIETLPDCAYLCHCLNTYLSVGQEISGFRDGG